ncbi:MAG: hypothetical protein U0R23_09180 [Candidatus Nanopelagicales bacterium]|jgi:hypothetical protein
MTRHPLDIFSLGSGLLVTILALGYLVAPDRMSAGIVFPLLLIGLGGFGIAGAVITANRTPDAQ